MIKTQRKQLEEVEPSLALCPFVLPKTHIPWVNYSAILDTLKLKHNTLFFLTLQVHYLSPSCFCSQEKQYLCLSKIHTMTLHICLWEQIILLLFVNLVSYTLLYRGGKDGTSILFACLSQWNSYSWRGSSNYLHKSELVT